MANLTKKQAPESGACLAWDPVLVAQIRFGFRPFFVEVVQSGFQILGDEQILDVVARADADLRFVRDFREFRIVRQPFDECRVRRLELGQLRGFRFFRFDDRHEAGVLHITGFFNEEVDPCGSELFVLAVFADGDHVVGAQRRVQLAAVVVRERHEADVVGGSAGCLDLRNDPVAEEVHGGFAAGHFAFGHFPVVRVQIFLHPALADEFTADLSQLAPCVVHLERSRIGGHFGCEVRFACNIERGAVAPCAHRPLSAEVHVERDDAGVFQLLRVSVQLVERRRRLVDAGFLERLLVVHEALRIDAGRDAVALAFEGVVVCEVDVVEHRIRKRLEILRIVRSRHARWHHQHVARLACRQARLDIGRVVRQAFEFNLRIRVFLLELLDVFVHGAVVDVVGAVRQHFERALQAACFARAAGIRVGCRSRIGRARVACVAGVAAVVIVAACGKHGQGEDGCHCDQKRFFHVFLPPKI
ncbi:hypothetical protein BN871_CV_00500 [Paenibacillus sp. P22]|nr:hypothetical protein BN871_CV_00500 [Paenibacillus sp. P22]